MGEGGDGDEGVRGGVIYIVYGRTEKVAVRFSHIGVWCEWLETKIVTSIAPEDGRISPKYVELKEHK